MLTKRTQILFDEDTWKLLKKRSKTSGTSVGEIVRKAVKKQFADIDIEEDRKRAHDLILKTRKVFKGKIDYKALINEGRKY